MKINKIIDSEEKTTKNERRKHHPEVRRFVRLALATLLILCTLLSMVMHLPYMGWSWYAAQLILLWLAADFITGIVHWWEDTYGDPTWPILGKYVVEPNMIHHRKPAKLLEGSYWNRINTSVIAAAAIGALLWFIGVRAWQVYALLLFCTQGNEIHAITHRADHLNGKLIRLMQKSGLIQDRKTHRWHHRAPYETNFCIMTEYINPILNKIDFWERIERVLHKYFNIEVLRGSEIRFGL